MKFFLRTFFTFLLSIIAFVFIFSFYRTPTLIRFSNQVEVYTILDNSNAKISIFERGDNPFYTFITGESCAIYDLSLKEVLSILNGKIYHTERIDNNLSIYGYSKKLPYAKQAFGKKINFQIVIKDGYLLLGTPVIYGSY